MYTSSLGVIYISMGTCQLSGSEDSLDQGLALLGGNSPKGSVISPEVILCFVFLQTDRGWVGFGSISGLCEI